jgi:hypothetical protein
LLQRFSSTRLQAGLSGITKAHILLWFNPFHQSKILISIKELS